MGGAAALDLRGCSVQGALVRPGLDPLRARLPPDSRNPIRCRPGCALQPPRGFDLDGLSKYFTRIPPAIRSRDSFGQKKLPPDPDFDARGNFRDGSAISCRDGIRYDEAPGERMVAKLSPRGPRLRRALRLWCRHLVECGQDPARRVGVDVGVEICGGPHAGVTEALGDRREAHPGIE